MNCGPGYRLSKPWRCMPVEIVSTTPARGGITSTDDGSPLLVVSAGDLTIHFQKTTGRIDTVSRAGKTIAAYKSARDWSRQNGTLASASGKNGWRRLCWLRRLTPVT